MGAVTPPPVVAGPVLPPPAIPDIEADAGGAGDAGSGGPAGEALPVLDRRAARLPAEPPNAP